MKPHVARTLRIAFSAAALVASEAAAQTDPGVMAATRRDLIREAQEARTAEDHGRALDLATRAGQLGMSASLRRFIAEEQNAQGLLGPALGSAELCAREAERDTSPARADHLSACQALAASLRPRVARLVVETPRIPGLQVRVADTDLPSAVWGVPYLVTPGTVLVTAMAPGYRPFRAELDVGPGGTRAVRVVLEEAPQSLELPAAPGGRSRGDDIRPVDARGGLNPGPVALLTVGGVGFVTAGIFYLMRGAALSDRDAQCDALGCPEAARPDHDRAVTFNTLTNVSLGVGAAFAAGGLVWYLIAPRRAAPAASPDQGPPARRAGLLFAPAPGGAMIGWEGTL
ncbi:MAG: hypothetical protein Q8S73_07880 [Deltaproteobacteria bacterium]|nr:hypothetical protein [Myxococcales bacterium]MDP3214007.1 hypothetical protein [Deltaproteobacteria bacterium]